MPRRKQEPPRAPRGSIGPKLLLGLTPELAERAVESAAREGVSVQEWWRRAGSERLLREEARKRGMFE
jgi:predicted HicB family RNase H-like nuclease